MSLLSCLWCEIVVVLTHFKMTPASESLEIWVSIAATFALDVHAWGVRIALAFRFEFALGSLPHMFQYMVKGKPLLSYMKGLLMDRHNFICPSFFPVELGCEVQSSLLTSKCGPLV